VGVVRVTWPFLHFGPL